MQKRHPVDIAPARRERTVASVRRIWRTAIGWPGLLVPLACLAGCNAADQPEAPTLEQRGPEAKPIVPADDPVLTLTDRRLPWPYAGASAVPVRYIEIVIDGIDNPKLIPLLFRVYAPDPAGGERLLGSFASYPGNRPGRYLIQVPPRSPLGDAIVLALEPAAEVSADDTVRVRIGAVRFLPAKAD
jgi:hypothetical protein